VGIKLGARFAPTSADINYDEIMESIKNGTTGKVADVEDIESSEHVEIWLE
jgi:translation elongation factor EF-1beta